ncbi:hypothetical protein MSPP1_001263 [Malassezia sp. CBS 17886]|nr:hypothetical protein MSPP1_001263 [Malassezia sp. CBS 17886]
MHTDAGSAGHDAPPPDEAASHAAFLAWLRTHGAHVLAGLKFCRDPQTGWGLATEEAIPRDTCVMRIPQALVIYSAACRDAVAGALGVLAPDANAESPAPRDWVTLYILLQRLLDTPAANAAQSTLLRHVPYARILPDPIPTPLTYTNAEIALLEGTSLFHHIAKRQEATAAAAAGVRRWLAQVGIPERPAWDPLRTAVQEPRWTALWRWSDDVYGSRSFPARIAGMDTEEPVLIPGLDSINHGRGEPVTWSFETGDVALTLRKDVARAAQVLNNYGAKSNEELLSAYGFVERGGPDDVLVLALASEGGAAQVYYWRREEEEPPAALLAALAGSGPLGSAPLGSALQGAAGGGALQHALADAHAVEALESFVTARQRVFRATQREVDDAEPWESGSQFAVRASVLDVIREYRRGQAFLLDRAVAWTHRRMDALLDELDALGYEEGGGSRGAGESGG